ncbi:hypothetical protein [Pantoea sp. C2G6]|uniref:hypothetical protein n=1 Tax=Pantoea sp. C2G6 TaxID=3243084 RepID=UPI003EDA5715
MKFLQRSPRYANFCKHQTLSTDLKGFKFYDVSFLGGVIAGKSARFLQNRAAGRLRQYRAAATIGCGLRGNGRFTSQRLVTARRIFYSSIDAYPSVKLIKYREIFCYS